MRTKMYKLPNGTTAVFDYDENGVGKVTVEAMDSIMGMIGAEPTGPTVKKKIKPSDNRLSIAKHYIAENIKKGRCGLFFTASLCLEDKKTTLYKGEGLEILICYEWEYFEVFGLTLRQQAALEKYYDKLVYGLEE